MKSPTEASRQKAREVVRSWNNSTQTRVYDHEADALAGLVAIELGSAASEAVERCARIAEHYGAGRKMFAQLAAKMREGEAPPESKQETER